MILKSTDFEAEFAKLLQQHPAQRHQWLAYDPILHGVARKRAQDMGARSYFDHVNPDGVGPNTLVRQAGFVLPSGYGSEATANNIESIQADTSSPSAALENLLSSPRHREHLLGETEFYADQDHYGIGHWSDPSAPYRNYWVVLISACGVTNLHQQEHLMASSETNQGSGQSKAELLLYLLDGSGSMVNPKEGGTATWNGRPKSEHLMHIVRGSLDELSKSDKAPAFRVAFVYFAGEATIAEADVQGAPMKYFDLDRAIEVLADPCTQARGNGTSFTAAVQAAITVLDEFDANSGLPDEKAATVFIFSDGQENAVSAEDCQLKLESLKLHKLAPTIAAISLGMDANEELLRSSANEPSEAQLRHLDMAGVLNLLPQSPRKLFLVGNAQGELTERAAQAIRRFVDTLSKTQAPTPAESSTSS